MSHFVSSHPKNLPLICSLISLISKFDIFFFNCDFLIYGLKYVFPAEPGAIIRGIPTAHSAPPINEHISSGTDSYVWPYAKGTLRGQAIEPLYKTIPMVAQNDKLFYELLVIIDTIRVGRAREIKIAVEELGKRLKYA